MKPCAIATSPFQGSKEVGQEDLYRAFRFKTEKYGLTDFYRQACILNITLFQLCCRSSLNVKSSAELNRKGVN